MYSPKITDRKIEEKTNYCLRTAISSQIQFVRNERQVLEEMCLCFDAHTLSHQLLQQKISSYDAIEQNLYALWVMARQVLKV